MVKSEKIKEAKDLIKLIDDTFDGKYGKCTCSRITLPRGREIISDVGYAWEFWIELKKDLKDIVEGA